MKKFLFFLLLFSTSAFATDFEKEADNQVKAHSCPMKSDERLICANVMCDFGLIMGEWSSECTQYKKDLAIYLATLGFWDKPPKCWGRDSGCKKDGKIKKNTVATSVCEDEKGNIDANCLKGLNVMNSDCDELSGKEKDQCYVDLAKANGECHQLSGDSRLKCIGVDGDKIVATAFLQANSSCKSVKEIADDPVQLDACVNATGADNAHEYCKLNYTGDDYLLCMNAVDTSIKSMY